MLIRADARHIPLKDKSVDCVVTSPPYWGLRRYPDSLQIGLEKTYKEYVAAILEVGKEVYRVLRDQGTFWLNLGDSYATGAGKVSQCPGGGWQGDKFKQYFGKSTPGSQLAMIGLTQPNRMPQPGLKPKDMCGIPWRVAFGLQDAGWFLRSEIIWAKPNPTPESVRDRPSRAHEQIFLLTKKRKYYYDADAISVLSTPGGWHGNDFRRRRYKEIHPYGGEGERNTESQRRNMRDVWTVPTNGTSSPHFATFPRKLIEPCILAGCPEGGIVLDPFCGSGTVIAACRDLGRIGIGIDLSWQDLAAEKIGGKLFASVINAGFAGDKL